MQGYRGACFDFNAVYIFWDADWDVEVSWVGKEKIIFVLDISVGSELSSDCDAICSECITLDVVCDGKWYVAMGSEEKVCLLNKYFGVLFPSAVWCCVALLFIWVVD